jgi:rod shape-determining protein MreD
VALVIAAVQLLLARYLPTALFVDLSLIFTLYIGWRSTPARGAVCGSILGILQDAVYRTVIGFNGLSKTVLGFSASYLSQWVSLEGSAFRIAALVILAMLDNWLVGGLQALIGEPAQEGFWAQAVARSLLTGVAGELVFRFYDRFKMPPKDFQRL